MLLLDEPTSSLTPYEAERLFAVMDSLRSSGIGVVFISHRLNEVSQACDRVVVLRDGRHAGEFPPDAQGIACVVEAMVPGTAKLVRRTRHGRFGDPALDLREVVVNSRPAVDLLVRAGEIVGIFGLVGAGKSSLARAVAGHIRIRSGQMRLAGQAFSPRTPAAAFERGVAYLSEDRRREGIFPYLSVRDNLVVRAPAETARLGVLRDQPIKELLQASRARLNIKAASDSLDIRSLSGGNQQKVLVGRLLAERLNVLILDEPTHGIDVRAKHDLLDVVGELTEHGLGVLMISSEIPELLAACDRVVVMRNGSLVAELPGDTATENQLMAAATGGK